jgi:hypothetical protein
MYEVLWVNLIPFWCMCLTRGLGLLPLVAFCELFVNFNGMIHVVTFWFGGNSWLPYLVSLTCLLSFFVRAHMTLAEMAWCSTLFVGYHLEVYSDYLCLMAWDICLWLLIPKDGSYLDHQYDLKRGTPNVVLFSFPLSLVCLGI